MGELSAAETLFSSVFKFSRSVSNSSTYTSQKIQKHLDYVDDVYIIVAYIFQKSEDSNFFKPPVLSSWRCHSQMRTGPVWHRGNRDPASGPSLESTPWNIWDRHLHHINIPEGFCAKTKKKKIWMEIGFYLIREMLECPAVLVTMLMSVRGLGSEKRNSNH